MLISPTNRAVQERHVRKDQSQTISLHFSRNGKNAKRRELLWFGLVVVLGLVAFLIERFSHAGVMVGVLYALTVMLASRLSFSYAVYIAAATCSTMTLSSLIPIDVDHMAWNEMTDRLLVLLAIWVSAFLSLLWEKPELESDGRTVNTPRSSGSVLRADVMTPESLDTSGESTAKNIDDLAELNRALLNKNQELETLINVVSHDLRSPLVNIQGFSIELSDSCDRLREAIEHSATNGLPMKDTAYLLDEEIPEAVRYIRAGAEKMNSVLSGILRFSRLGRISLNCEQLNVNCIVSGIATVMEFQLKEKGILLQIDDLPDCIGDEVLVSQVFSNLIENAYKYLDPVRPGVIRVSGKVKDGKTVYAVEDNGVGIRQDHQGKIFEMFHRLNPKDGSGEGLGLTIVRRIVERHQGEVWVDSEFGSGTTFFVSLPCAQTVHEGEQS